MSELSISEEYALPFYKLVFTYMPCLIFMSQSLHCFVLVLMFCTYHFLWIVHNSTTLSLLQHCFLQKSHFFELLEYQSLSILSANSRNPSPDTSLHLKDELLNVVWPGILLRLANYLLLVHDRGEPKPNEMKRNQSISPNQLGSATRIRCLHLMLSLVKSIMFFYIHKPRSFQTTGS